jgi:hypothetical protein
MDDAGFDVLAGQRLLAARTATVAGRPLGVAGGLPGEGLGEDLFRQDFADVEQQMFNLGKSGSPGRPLRPVELIDQVFRHALDIGPYFFYQRGALFGLRHPWLLS